MICEAGLELHARCQATPLSLPDPCDRQLLTRVPFPPTPGLGTSFSFTLPELPSLTHCSHGPAPASLLWGPSVDAAPGAPGPHLGHTWATPRPHLGHTWTRPSSSLLLKPLRALCYQGLRLLYLQGPTHMPGRKWKGRYPPDAIKIIRVCAQSCVQNPMLIFCGCRNK